MIRKLKPSKRESAQPTSPPSEIVSLPLTKLEYSDGSGWYPLATEPYVDSKVFDINTNTSGQLTLSRLQFYPANSSVFLRGDGTWSSVPSGSGTVTSINAGVGLSGGTITTSGTIAIANVGITAGTYTWPNSLNINAQGQVIGANSGLQPFTSLIAGTGISLAQGGGSAQINIFNTGVSPGFYTWPSDFSVNQQGQLTNVTSSGSLPINRLQNYPANSTTFLRGDGIWATPTASSIDINSGTIGQLNISRLSGYPASSNSFLRGDGTWTLPFINNLPINGTVSFSSYGLTTFGNVNATTGTLIGNNLAAYNSGSIVVQNPLSMSNGGATPISITTNAASGKIYFNNTNTSSYATGLIVQNNGVDAVEFGFNNSTSEAYFWSGSGTLKFGTNFTKRMDIANNSGKTTFYDGSIQCYIRPSSNYLDLRGAFVHGSKTSAIMETNNLGETASIVMNGDYIQTIQPFDDLGFIFTDEDLDPATTYQSYISANGSLVTSSSERRKHSLREKKHKDYLERLNQLKVYSYALRVPVELSDNEKRKTRKYYKNRRLHVGLLAEEVEQLFDNATDGFKLIDLHQGNEKEFNKLTKNYSPQEKEEDFLKRKNADRQSPGIHYDTLVCYTILALQELTKKVKLLEKNKNIY